MNASPRLLTAALLLTAACSSGPAQPDASTEGGATDGGKDVAVKDVSTIDAPVDAPVQTVNLDCTQPPGNDAGSTDAGSTDAGSADAGDAGADAGDAGSTDAGSTDAGGSTKGSCVTIDDAGVSCNPVTNEGCNAAAGEACDVSQTGFQCWSSPPNTGAVCTSCDLQNGPACLPTLTCVDTGNGTKCGRYCCVDSDCGSGHCDTSSFGTAPAGVCVQ